MRLLVRVQSGSWREGVYSPNDTLSVLMSISRVFIQDRRFVFPWLCHKISFLHYFEVLTSCIHTHILLPLWLILNFTREDYIIFWLHFIWQNQLPFGYILEISEKLQFCHCGQVPRLSLRGAKRRSNLGLIARDKLRNLCLKLPNLLWVWFWDCFRIS